MHGSTAIDHYIATSKARVLMVLTLNTAACLLRKCRTLALAQHATTRLCSPDCHHPKQPPQPSSCSQSLPNPLSRTAAGHRKQPCQLPAATQPHARAAAAAALCGHGGAELGAGLAGANADGGGLAADGDVDGGAHLGALGQRLVHGVLQELGDDLGLDALLGVNGGEGLLLQDVVEAGSPLAGAQAGGVRAVVHHEGDAARVHVGVQGVHGLNDGLVADLGVAVALLAQHLDGGHHGGDVHAGGEGVQGDVLLHALGAHLLAHLPHVGAVNLAHGEAVKAGAGLHHGADLVARGHVLVDLQADVHGGLEGRGVGLLEHLLASLVQLVVHGQHALGGDGLGDGAGD
mmetsp:Transcript_34561/g.87392  ORF Transcript_34561/g.87392 Transcript_34561/m.87392 type:complete len:346 (+) Transcript_34561:220-1257(+)